jgi:hypothetical protein
LLQDLFRRKTLTQILTSYNYVLPEMLPVVRLYILLTHYIQVLRMIRHHPKTFGVGEVGKLNT